MASVVITGDTSGAITLAAPSVAGTNTITLPASTGTMALTASPTFTGTATIPTATVTTLNAPSGVLATQNGMTGIAKAWVNFNLATSTIRQSFNVSSITFIGTANAQVNFTTAMTDANFAALTNCETGTAIPNVTGYNASYVQVYFPYYNGPFVNPSFVSVAVFR
jgi:hypothetical protein